MIDDNFCFYCRSLNKEEGEEEKPAGSKRASLIAKVKNFKDTGVDQLRHSIGAITNFYSKDSGSRARNSAPKETTEINRKLLNRREIILDLF